MDNLAGNYWQVFQLLHNALYPIVHQFAWYCTIYTDGFFDFDPTTNIALSSSMLRATGEVSLVIA